MKYDVRISDEDPIDWAADPHCCVLHLKELSEDEFKCLMSMLTDRNYFAVIDAAYKTED